MESGSGSTIPIDLVVVNGGGAKSSVLTPSSSNSQNVQFQLPSDAKLSPHNNWACIDGFRVSVSGTFDQAASGGSAVNADQLPVIVKSFLYNNPNVFGVMMDDQVYTGTRTKNIVERVSNGYKGWQWDRAQIASSDGDSTYTLYFKLPFGTKNQQLGPESCWHWAGWHKNGVLTVTLDVSTAIAAASTGAVVKSNTTIKAWCSAKAMRNPPFPLIPLWKQYLSPVISAGNQIVLKNLGDKQRAANVSSSVRIATLVELMNVLGLGGASTADTITDFWCPQLNQDRVDNIEAFMLEFRDQIGAHVGAANLHDGAGFPMTMAATPNGSIQVSTLLGLFWRYSTPRQKLANLVRWQVPADLTYYRDQPSGGPSSGNHVILTQEIHEPDPSAEATLRKMAGNLTAPIVFLDPSVAAAAAAGKLKTSQAFGQPRVFKAS